MPRRKVLRLRRLMLLRLAQPAPHRHPRHDRVRRANVVTAEDGRGSSTGCGVHHRARGRAVMVGRRPDAAGCAVSLAPRDILTYPRTSKRDAGRAQDHADRLLLEATLVGSAISLRRGISSALPGRTISTILLDSRTVFLLAGSRHWPAVSNTVSPSGKRGVISLPRNCSHCVFQRVSPFPLPGTHTFVTAVPSDRPGWRAWCGSECG